MSDRITNRDLESLCTILNRKTGADNEPWTRVDGQMRANIGTHYIDGAYGGVALYRIVTDGGGVTDVFHSGHVAKRDLYNRMRAYLDGMEAAKRDCVA